MIEPTLQRPLTVVKPTPLHPLEEIPLNLNPSRRTTASELERQGSTSTPFPGRSIHPLPNLPARGTSEDAQEALARLERIACRRGPQKKWRKPTGLGGALYRKKAAELPDDASDSSSSESIDLSRAFEEVKLRITNLPGHPAVGRVRNVASKARDRIGTAEADSPDHLPNFGEGQDDGGFRFPAARLIGAAARRISLGRTPPPPADSEPKDPNKALEASSSTSSANVANATSRASLAPSGSDTDGSRIRAVPSQNPELLVVDEHGREKHAEDDNAAGHPRRPALLARGSDTSGGGLNADWSSSSTPSAEPDAVRPAFNLSPAGSFTCWPIHDEPEEYDPHPARRNEDGPMSPSASPSSTSGYSDSDEDGRASGNDSDSSGSEDPHVDHGLMGHGSVSLQHGEPLTKQELRQRKRLERRELRRRRRRAAKGLSLDDTSASRSSHLGPSLGNRVSRGLHYASNHSRNRRAMERYSPNPVKQLQMLTDEVPRSGTPSQSGMSFERPNGGADLFSALSPSSSRGGQSVFASRRESNANSRRSSLAEQDRMRPVELESILSPAREDGSGGPNLGQWNTHVSVVSPKASLRKFVRSPNMLRRHHHGNSEFETAALQAVAAAAAAASPAAAPADPEKEIDQWLGRVVAVEAPSDGGKERYEFDVLYENQRGLLVFGIPKFSPRTLFQWDPSPWTTASNRKSPYNIANAQLPDPSWDWVYPEWLIDMTGDTDEAGWQYSGNFGRRFWPNVHFPHGKIGLPRTGAAGQSARDARHARKRAKRHEKEDRRVDDGLEALKRTARAKSNKWQGTPDSWTFVRRRRWIRLRRRRPLALAGPPAASSKEDKASSPAPEEPGIVGDVAKVAAAPDAGSSPDSTSSFADSDEEDEVEDYYDDRDYAGTGAGPSAFLPRRTPGDLRNGPNPLRHKKGLKSRRAERHITEFTGTIRELKSLLPTLMAGEKERSYTDDGGAKSKAVTRAMKLDVRNPFISWKFVKSRLGDNDMADAGSALRRREERFQKRLDRERQASHKPMATVNPFPSRSIPPQFLPSSATAAAQSPPPTDFPPKAGERVSEATPLPAPEDECRGITREALIEINYSRVVRSLRACKADRQRVDLWKLWLGIESLDSLLENARNIDFRELELVANSPSPPPSVRHDSPGPNISGGATPRHRQRGSTVKARWRAALVGPDPLDVWDVLERKLDDILLLFEFQSSRAILLRMLLAIHSFSHAEHVYRDRSLRGNPDELSPIHAHGTPSEMGGATPAYSDEGWQKAGLPRLEFFSDVQDILHSLPGPERPQTEAAQERICQLQDVSTSSLSMLLHPNSSMEVLNLPSYSPQPYQGGYRTGGTGFSPAASGRIVPPSRTQSASPSVSFSLLSSPSSPAAGSASLGSTAAMQRASTLAASELSSLDHQPAQLMVPPFQQYRGQRTGSPLVPPRGSSSPVPAQMMAPRPTSAPFPAGPEVTAFKKS